MKNRFGIRFILSVLMAAPLAAQPLATLPTTASTATTPLASWPPGILVFHGRVGEEMDIFASTDGGRTIRNLTLTPDGDSCPRLSPDGSRVVFQSNRPSNPTSSNAASPQSTAGGLRHGRPHLFVVPVSGGPPTAITSGSSLDQSPCWSPDGASIYFETHRGKSWKIARVSAAGGPVTTLTPDILDCLAPAVSPDGMRLACQVRRSGSERWEIAILDLSGRILSTHAVPGASFNETPSFSSDGKAVLFAASAGNGYEIARASLEGTAAPVLVTRTGGWKMHPIHAGPAGWLLLDMKTPDGWRPAALPPGQSPQPIPISLESYHPDWRPAGNGKP